MWWKTACHGADAPDAEGIYLSSPEDGKIDGASTPMAGRTLDISCGRGRLLVVGTIKGLLSEAAELKRAAMRFRPGAVALTCNASEVESLLRIGGLAPLGFDLGRKEHVQALGELLWSWECECGGVNPPTVTKCRSCKRTAPPTVLENYRAGSDRAGDMPGAAHAAPDNIWAEGGPSRWKGGDEVKGTSPSGRGRVPGGDDARRGGGRKKGRTKGKTSLQDRAGGVRSKGGASGPAFTVGDVLTKHDEIFLTYMRAFGRVRFPSPAFMAAVRLAGDRDIPLLGVDMDEDEFSEMHVSEVGYLDLLRSSRAVRKIELKGIRAQSPQDLVMEWDRRVNGFPGYRRVEDIRAGHMAKKLRRICRRHERVLVVTDLERRGLLAGHLEGE